MSADIIPVSDLVLGVGVALLELGAALVVCWAWGRLET